VTTRIELPPRLAGAATAATTSNNPNAPQLAMYRAGNRYFRSVILSGPEPRRLTAGSPPVAAAVIPPTPVALGLA
jgi:hypothetical protein